MNHRSSLAALTLFAILGACASQDPIAGPSSSAPPSTTAPTETTSGGWVGGEPDWSAGGGAGGEGGEAAAGGPAASDSGADKAATESAAGDYEASAAPTPAVVGPVDTLPVMPDSSPLRAGSVDDNADFAAFVEYLERIADLGITTRPFDPSGRIVVSARRPDGLPAAGVEIAIAGADGSAVATVRTTANGSARFLPALYGPIQESYGFSALGTEEIAAPGGTVALMVEPQQAATERVAVDVLFLLDATGSMGDEIDRLKTTIDSVAGRIEALDTRPDVRFGMTLYRDLEDSFVTSTFDLTNDLEAFRSALNGVSAEGGGDYPEALDEGLADALSTPSWRDPSSTIQLVFVIADAPPQVNRQVTADYVQSIAEAISRGITIIPIASSESDDQAEAVFRQIAAATGARFVFLSNGAAGAATGANTDIASTDYEELSLDDLIVRFVSEQLAALTGAAPSETGPVQTDPTTSSTNPDGQ